MPSLPEVKTFLVSQGIEVWEFRMPTPTSPAAAAAVGCSLAEIAKTLLFLVGGQPVAVATCGDMRVNSSLLKQAANLPGKVKLPESDEVLHYTGYAPGGVCPFLLPGDLPLFLDRSLQRFSRVYAAAGNDYSAVPISWEQLVRITAGQPADLCYPFPQ